MGEVISLSYGQDANHIITHLYNTEESLIPYTPDAVIHHDLQVFLSRFRASASSSASYSPRALIYDLRNGLGSLNKYEYHETIPQLDLPMLNQNPPGKNEYQRKLDQGVADGSLLNTLNTTYWTDYNKLIYNPKSLNTVINFIQVPNAKGHHFNFDKLKFEFYNIGQEEFKENSHDDDDKLIEGFRYFLEKTDTLQGLQFLTNIDDAWGGFTSEMILSLVDEYFNNNNKMNMWIYGILDHSQGNTIRNKVSRIKTLVELTKQLSLMFPMDLNDLKQNSLLTENFDEKSWWHKSSIPAMFINSIWGLNSQEERQINMSHIQGNILKYNGNRKIVNEIKIVGEKELDGDGMVMQDIDITNFDFSSLGVAKQTKEINLGISKSNNPRNFVKNYISAGKLEVGGEDTYEYVNPYIGNILDVDTFPSDILASGKKTKFYTEFNMHEGLKAYLKPYEKLIYNIRNQIEDIIEDKNELLEDLSNIIQEYSYGYESDEDYD
ncbi:Protein DML1 [Candida viswanathii]|uniref:Protein DML1 n=1 Tax=Candida viswanathii TaxID=5486 RepID=A0A367YHS0_9ASCO|nr:Protein DML1 [Candida viswanathii]